MRPVGEAAATRHCVVCHAPHDGPERFCSIDGGAIVDDQPGDQRIGTTIDERYLVRRFIGRGGMGEVYEADHVGLDRPVAIKFVTGASKSSLARFRREARVASKIAHEHVVQIFDVGADAGVDFIVMEYVEGRDLDTLLRAEGRLAPERATAIARQMLAGLDAIHRGGILHRDIKPANIVLTTRGADRDFVKIMDFGISRSVDDTGVTATGAVVGTPQFIAPEMLHGGPVDHRADLYAVGVTLYIMLAGETPFPDVPFEQLVALQVTTIPARLDTVRTDLPPPLVEAVVRALDTSPERRFPDALAFADALASPHSHDAATVDALGPTRTAARPPVRRVRWPWLALAAALAGGTIVVLAVTGEQGAGETGDYCYCSSRDAPTRESLCRARVDPRCSCIDPDTRQPLCPSPPTTCTGCEAHERGCVDSTCNTFGFRCEPNPSYASDSLPGHTSNEACKGYDGYGPDVVDGRYHCNVCVGERNLMYRGHTGEACRGFDRAGTIATAFAGTLQCQPTQLSD